MKAAVSCQTLLTSLWTAKVKPPVSCWWRISKVHKMHQLNFSTLHYVRHKTPASYTNNRQGESKTVSSFNQDAYQHSPSSSSMFLKSKDIIHFSNASLARIHKEHRCTVLYKYSPSCHTHEGWERVIAPSHLSFSSSTFTPHCRLHLKMWNKGW